MANEQMHMHEGFQAEVKRAAPPPEERPAVQPRHYVIGWSVILMIVAALGYGGYQAVSHRTSGTVLLERPGLTEGLQHKISGVLHLTHLRHGNVLGEWSFPNTIVNAGETALRDCFGGTGTPTCTAVQNFKYHGLGTSSVAVAETDTGCGTELTTQYNPDNTRATGTQTNNGANVYRTVGTNTVDAAVTIQEFCLMSQAATGGGTMWTRILTGAISLNAGDSLQTTYDLTIE